MSDRKAMRERNTRETQLRVEIDLDGEGCYSGSVGVPFLEHMLELFARHGLMDLTISGKGDLEVDAHHTVEDLGIVLGQAIAGALGDKAGLTRYGCALIPMDEALVRCVLDISGRPFLHYQAVIAKERIGDFEVELTEEFLRALATQAGLTLHVELLHGQNAHHAVEAIFKALGRALRQALTRDPREGGKIPSTKGVL